MTVFNTKGVCSRSIEIELDGDTIKSVDEAISRLKGIDCGGRGTSCPDQLAKALEQMKTQNA